MTDAPTRAAAYAAYADARAAYVAAAEKVLQATIASAT